jgi:hypothetical protein
MTVHWACMACEASGTGDRAAEQHVRDTTHSTETRSRPWMTEEQQSVRYWLTDAAYVALAELEGK